MIVGIAQISPIWLNKVATIEKVVDSIIEAANEKCELVVFGEGLLPGYPFWLSYTNGATFEDPIQKEMFAIYHQNAVNVEQDDLSTIQNVCKENKIAAYLGVIEKSKARSGHTLYCSLIFIDPLGAIKSVHRKLVPTYEERLVWGNGDGHGLKTHALNEFTIGGLNCWENWMPLSRTALYAQGENLHVAVWPGSDYNTKDITRFIAKESRSYVISASNVLKLSEINSSIPVYDQMQKKAPKTLANGGSCIAKPNGEWLVEPVLDTETIIIAELEIDEVRKERQNFDPTGHYSRPDVLSLNLNNERQEILKK